MNDDNEIINQLKAIHVLLSGVIEQLEEDACEDDMEGPEKEEDPISKIKKSLLARGM